MCSLFVHLIQYIYTVYIYVYYIDIYNVQTDYINFHRYMRLDYRRVNIGISANHLGIQSASISSMFVIPKASATMQSCHSASEWQNALVIFRHVEQHRFFDCEIRCLFLRKKFPNAKHRVTHET